MSVVVVTGSSGLIGSEGALFYLRQGYQVVGIDNNMRQYFLAGGSPFGSRRPRKSVRTSIFIIILIFDLYRLTSKKYENDISLIIHTAAQPSMIGPLKNL